MDAVAVAPPPPPPEPEYDYDYDYEYSGDGTDEDLEGSLTKENKSNTDNEEVITVSNETRIVKRETKEGDLHEEEKEQFVAVMCNACQQGVSLCFLIHI